MELWRWDVSWIVLWRWGRLLFKQEDMKEEGAFFFGSEMKGEKGCCDEFEKVVVVKFIKGGKKTHCSWDSGHGGRGGVLWV